MIEIERLLEGVKENTKTARYWERYLKGEKVFDMLINDAAAFGLKENFSNVPEIIGKLMASKWGLHEHIEGKDFFLTYTGALCYFITYLEAKEAAVSLTKQLFKGCPNLLNWSLLSN